LCATVAGIMVTTKKRQDFRIQLQKRARRRAEKKIEYLEDDKNWKDVSNVLHAHVPEAVTSGVFLVLKYFPRPK